ncbi:RraA family protein [uncultured Devosia sp.]|uniref:RraA family protein n=1 Tax=uncultured Devosia sp. TaxID=211434 RepID=UPI0035CBFB50
MPAISSDVLAALRAADTPTVCNALEHVMGGRTAEGFTKMPVVCADPHLPPIVGFARTAKIRASSPAQQPTTAVRALRMEYYEHVAAGEGPNVAVIEDTDFPHAIGGFWGEMQVAQHKGLGLAGTLTNGVLRDLGMLDEGYQVIAGSVGPSHAFVHVTELDCVVSVFGMVVRPDDLIHADRHGAVVIPAQHIERMAWAIDVVMRKEVPILTAARAPGFTVAKLRAAWAEADGIG